MSLPTPTEEQLKASNEALKSLPCYTKHEPGTGEFAVLDSSTEERIATWPDLSPADAISEVAIADMAGRNWAKTTPRHRSGTLHNVYFVLIANKHRLAYVISREMGKRQRTTLRKPST